MRNWLRALVIALVIPALAACSTIGGSTPRAHAGDYPEAALYDASADARDDIKSALGIAGASEDTFVLAIFGANWCHDSRALAGWLQTPRFQALTDAHYQVVYIDAGVPQTGEGRNLDLAEELGVPGITGTPTLLVLDDEGNLLNTPEDAKSWRNSARRSEDEVFAYLEDWTQSAE